MAGPSTNAEDRSAEPSITVVPSAPPVENTPVLSGELCKKLWKVESKIFPGFNLHELYEIQRDLLFAMFGIDMGTTLSHKEFQLLWGFFYERYEVENLFVEILAPGSI
jgi:hypothetical protein